MFRVFPILLSIEKAGLKWHTKARKWFPSLNFCLSEAVFKDMVSNELFWSIAAQSDFTDTGKSKSFKFELVNITELETFIWSYYSFPLSHFMFETKSTQKIDGKTLLKHFLNWFCCAFVRTTVTLENLFQTPSTHIALRFASVHNHTKSGSV